MVAQSLGCLTLDPPRKIVSDQQVPWSLCIPTSRHIKFGHEVGLRAATPS